MKPSILIPVLALAVLVSPLPGADTSSDRAVMAPAKRLDGLKLAARVLAPRQATWKTSGVDLPDPFYRTNFARDKEEPPPVETPKRSERSDGEVLAEAADQLNFAGTMMVDGENYLLLGGKRYRVGSELPVTIDGLVYKITISEIEGKSFTLRLNQQELRRQLK